MSNIPKKRIAIFGSTGSIGTQALDVIAANPDLFSAEVLTAMTNHTLLIEQAIRFEPAVVVIGEETKYHLVKEALAGKDIKVFCGMPD
jgi:1-deoxy-D-xylulose-5-phosphate reductoisomerase